LLDNDAAITISRICLSLLLHNSKCQGYYVWCQINKLDIYLIKEIKQNGKSWQWHY